MIWDESTNKCIKNIKDVRCCPSSNMLSKLNDNTVLVGGENVIYLVDIQTYKINLFQDLSLGYIHCLNVIRNGLVLFGNDEGEICCYDSSSNKIIFKKIFHDGDIFCIIQTQDDKIVSCSYDRKINIYN